MKNLITASTTPSYQELTKRQDYKEYSLTLSKQQDRIRKLGLTTGASAAFLYAPISDIEQPWYLIDVNHNVTEITAAQAFAI